MSLRPRARIHLANIADNWRLLSEHHAGGDVAAVIKADAYGHGLTQVAAHLSSAGCQHFFVAHSFEGVAARDAIGPEAKIYVLNGPDPYGEPTYRRSDLIPVINSIEQYQTLDTWQAASPLTSGYVLHFDTGMNRLGLPLDEAAKLASASKTASPTLIMTHLACSEQSQARMNAFQLAQFQIAADHFSNVATSISNSGGLWLGSDYHADIIRAGIALYGGGFPPQNIDLKPGLTLEAPILQVRTVSAGDSIGYGATHRFTEPTRVATVAIGYGDGFLRSASNAGYAMLGGKKCQIIGRVSMDLITIDVSAATDLARPGVFAQFIGPDAPLEEQAALAGTIGYELTTGLTPRVTRLYEN